MASFFKSWGLDGSLKVTDFSSLHSNGLTGNPTSVHGVGEAGNQRCNRIIVDGHQALEMVVFPTDASAASGHRTELLPATTTGGTSTDFVGIADWGGADATKQRWYRVMFKIPKFDTSWLANPNSYMLVAQLHQEPDTTPADEVSNPPLYFEIRQDTLQITNVSCAQQVTTSSNRTFRTLATLPLKFDEWYDFVINVQWSWTTLGKIRIWKDRKLIYHDVAAPNCANNTTGRGSNGNYAKFGIYTGYPLTTYTNQTLKVYHRGMIVGNETATFADMYPELPNAIAINPDISSSVLMPYLG